MQSPGESPAFGPDSYQPNQDDPGIPGLILGAIESSRRQLTDLLGLASMEARYSVLMLAVVIWMGLLALLAGISVWGLLMAMAITVLMDSGWSAVSALSVAALANGLLILIAIWVMRRAINKVGFSATRRVLESVRHDELSE